MNKNNLGEKFTTLLIAVVIITLQMQFFDSFKLVLPPVASAQVVAVNSSCTSDLITAEENLVIAIHFLDTSSPQSNATPLTIR